MEGHTGQGQGAGEGWKAGQQNQAPTHDQWMQRLGSPGGSKVENSCCEKPGVFTGLGVQGA